jgi:hypothetical protein
MTPFITTKLCVRVCAGVNSLEVGSFFYITIDNRIPRLSSLVVKTIVGTFHPFIGHEDP